MLNRKVVPSLLPISCKDTHRREASVISTKSVLKFILVAALVLAWLYFYGVTSDPSAPSYSPGQ